MKKLLAIVFIIGGLFIGYLGLENFQKSTNSAEVLGVEISANDQGGQMTGIIEMALALALFGSGIYLASKKS